MKEEFLHFVWKYGLFTKASLRTPDGDLIEVIHPGEYNRDSGPDFFNARLRHSGIEWAGNVEIHVKASDFYLHGHCNDHAYNSVILHVVAENDRGVIAANNQELMTAELKIEEGVFERYQDLVNKPYSVACQEMLPATDRFAMYNWIDALTVERLEDKYNKIRHILSRTGNDWEETLYRVIARYFGFRVNREPFEMLAAALPLKLIRKHGDDMLQVEALLFGAAGMLEDDLFRNAAADDYYRDLTREYRMLSSKYRIKPVNGWLWKFGRLRPVNFPTIRIAQLAALLRTKEGLFARIAEAKETSVLKNLLAAKASEYWDDHYVFGRRSSRRRKSTGEDALNIFLINAVIPVLFAYGRAHGSDEICSRAMDFLESIPPEDNRIIREWHASGVEALSASHTQGLLRLREEYCNKRRCLICRIGSVLVARGSGLKKAEELLLEP